MNSSGIKRGLATTAISALAVTGLPFLATSASGVPADSQVETADSVYLVAPETAGVSAQNDGQNTTVRLEAIGGTGVPEVRFQYSLNGGATWTTIATVGRNDNGAFSHEWDATPVAGAPAVTLRAVEFTGGAVVDSTTPDNSQIVAVNNTLDSVNITDGTGVGVFQTPYGSGEQNVIVSGTASDGGNPTDLSFWDDDTDGGTAGNQPGYVNGTGDIDDTTGTGDTTDSWTGVLNIDGYNYNGSPDELVVNADNGDTDDAESFGLYVQQIATVTAEASDTNVPAGSGPVDVVVTVLDQNGLPIAGARVVSSDGSQTDFTDSNGEADFTQGPGTDYYYADATNAAGYQSELGDRRSENVTVTQYNAEPTSLEGSSDNGAAFDVDEYDANDITVQVSDQNDNDIDTTDQDLEYYWVFTPFNGAATERTPATGTDSVDGATSTDGEYTVPLPADYATQSGTYELFAGLSEDSLGNDAVASSKVLEVKAGDSDIVFDGAEPTVAPAGGDATISGSLELGDGTGLPGRPITLTYAGGNAAFDQTTGPDAPSRTVTTDANGDFSATLDDPTATPQTTETGTVTAVTDSYDDQPGAGVDPDDADETATQDVVFAQNEVPAGATVEITPINGNGKPGVARSGEVTVETEGGAPIANQTVTLTIDGDSFFTNGSQEPGPTGSDAGDLTTRGQTITVVTEADGTADFMFAVERSEEFDDDGLAEDIVTATAGSVSDTEDVDYSSADPLNGGEVRLEFSPASEQDAGNNPPSARPGTEVEIDVYTEDQFGNLVGGELVTISDNTVDADIIADDADPAAGIQVLSNFDDNGDFSVTADEEEEQVITAEWTTDTEVLDGADNPVDGPDETLTDEITVNYSDANITDETVTMTASPEGNVSVGTAVTETVTVLDDEGNPVAGVLVRFTQSGPGDANTTVDRFTNDQGQAFYTFVGTEKGTAFITAVVETGGTPVVESDEVKFVGDKVNPGLVVRGRDNGAKDDKVVARAINLTAGATVRLYRKTSNGLKFLRSDTMNSKGNHKFTGINDKNGNKRTKYVVKVSPTDETRSGRGARKVR